MRTTLAIMAFAVSTFCLMETVMGIFISYLAYVRGAIRGLPFHAYAQTTFMFMAATGIFCWAGLGLWPKRSS